jgi:hypothetical protein
VRLLGLLLLGLLAGALLGGALGLGAGLLWRHLAQPSNFEGRADVAVVLWTLGGAALGAVAGAVTLAAR